MTTDRAHRSVDELVELVLGAERRWTREQVAVRAGVPLAEARRLWRAMGFADVGDAVQFTDGDVEALAGSSSASSATVTWTWPAPSRSRGPSARPRHG